MKPVYLIRHGQSLGNLDPEVGGWADTDLSPLGVAQAEVLASRLASMLEGTPVELISSPLKRARHTAEIIRAHLGIEPVFIKDLEAHRSGFTREVSWSEGMKHWTEVPNPTHLWRPFRGGESLGEIFDRASAVMEELVSNQREVMIVVSHSFTINAIVSWWLGLKKEDLTSFMFRTDNSSITELDYNNEGDRMLWRLNDVSHLSALDVKG